MSKSNFILLAFIIVNLHLFVIIGLVGVSKQDETPKFHQVPPPPPFEAPIERKPDISITIAKGELSTEQVFAWLERLSAEAPDQTEVGLVGQSSSGRDIKYIRIGPKNDGPKVLITSCVHGNEKLSCSVAISVITKLLDNYMEDEKVTELLRTRQLYYIPIVCPDGYANGSRHEDNLDPNRNWNDYNLKERKSIPSVQALKEFHLKHKFDAVMSCHNYGRIYFLPWGHIRKKSKDWDSYKRIMSSMSKVSGYKYEQLLRQSAPPYYGYEVDWYHKHGAFSIVNEIGRNFSARPQEILSETENNYPAFMIFIEEGGLVNSQNSSEWVQNL